jgi:hypothetical protein
MNYLQLCQKLRQEVGGSGSGPSTVLGQAGENQLYVGWIHDAWLGIQTSREQWKFMWAQGSLSLAIDTQVYSLPTDLKSIDRCSVRINGYQLIELIYTEFRDHFPTASKGKPAYFCIMPNGQMKVNTLPDQIYLITFDYYKAPQELSANTDIPWLPAEYHLLIVYEAMLSYGGYENATEVYQRARIKYDQLSMDVERTQLPQLELAGPLA